jgi:hypothetical protein
VKLNIDIVTDFMYQILKSSLLAIEEKPKLKSKELLNESRRQIFSKLAFFEQTNVSSEIVAEYLAKLFLRAQNDNPGIFWENRRDNLYCALYKPTKRSITSQAFFLLSCINLMKRQKKYGSMFNLRQILVAKRNMINYCEEINKDELIKKKKTKFFKSKVDISDMNERNYFFDPDDDEFEDRMDEISGGDDPEDFLERSWGEEGDEEEYIIYNDVSFNFMMEKTLKSDYSCLTLKFVGESIYIPWLGYANYDRVQDQNGVVWNVAHYPGSSKPPKRLMSEKPKSSLRVGVKNIALHSDKYKKMKLEESKKLMTEGNEATLGEENKEEIEIEEAKNTRDKMVDKNKLLSFESDEAAYQYQIGVLRENGIPNPEKYKKYFFRKSNLDQKDRFWQSFGKALNAKKEIKIKNVTSGRSMRTSILPGFSGNLNDHLIKSELTAFFGDHSEEIVSGNHRMSSSVYKNLLFTFRRLFHLVKTEYKAVIIIILAIMKDCIIDENNDNWLVNPIYNIVNEMDDSLSHNDDRMFVAPQPVDSVLIYEVTSEYE